MNERAKLSQIIVQAIEEFPKVHKFLVSGDTGCHPQHLVTTIADKILASKGETLRENILTGIAAQLKAELTEAQEEVERLKQYTDPKLFAAASTVLEVAGKGSDEEVDLALVMLDEAVKWWDSLPWKPGDAGIELPKYEG